MQLKPFRYFLNTAFTLLMVAFSFTAVAGGDSHSEEKEFSPKEMIMHHISDAHEFHIMGEGESSVALPLPIILWTDNGFVSFLSSAFHHNDDGTHAVERNGMKFVKFHEKIYYANEAGIVSLDADEHATNLKPLDFSITKNVFSMFFSVCIILLLFVSTAKFYKKNGNVAPKGLAAFMEPIILFVRDDIAIPNIGKHAYQRFMPFLLTIFFFIWINNLLGLIPFFPGSANLTGNIAFTMVMSVIVLVVVNVHGNKHYWRHIFWMPGVPAFVKIILTPIEIAGIFIKPVALMIRLFANITAGHIIILSLISLIFIFQSYAIAPVSIAFVLFMNVLELLVAALQAFIFTMLTALFIGSAVEEAH
jgi:F-type H+-transporting ATPase subunit a